jgi:AcrR family transcriptional regulator
MIIDTAVQLFLQRGMSAVSSRDLADEAGLSRSHVYHYFKDWGELRLAAFDRFAYADLDTLRDILHRLDPSPALFAFIEFSLPTRRDQTWALWMDVFNESVHDSALRARYVQALTVMQGLLKEVIQEGIVSGEFSCADANRAARQLSALINGYVKRLLLKPTPKDARLARDEILEVARLLLARG